MEVINLETFRNNKGDQNQRTITFRSSEFQDNQGNSKTININVTVGDGDVFGILDVVKEEGGIGMVHDDGVYYFIPWPCACVEIKQ